MKLREIVSGTLLIVPNLIAAELLIGSLSIKKLRDQPQSKKFSTSSS